MQKRKKIQSIVFWSIILAIFFTLFSIFFFPGYRTEAEDQSLYTPPILQYQNPDFFLKDFLMENPQTAYTFYDELIAFFLKTGLNIYSIYFLFSFLSRFLFFLGIILISKGITKDISFSLFSPLIFILGHAGYVCNGLPPKLWLFNFGMELHARSLAISLLCISLGLFLNKKVFWAWFISALVILIHMISAIPFFIFLTIYTLTNKAFFLKKKNYLKYFSFPIITFFILIITSFLTKNKNGFEIQLFSVVDLAWKAFMEESVSYLFISKWFSSRISFSYVILPFIVFFFISQNNKFLKEESKKIIQYFVLIIVGLVFIGLIGFDFLKIALFGQLQFLRSLLWLQILFPLSVCFVFYKAAKQVVKNDFSKAIIFIVSFLGLILGHPGFLPFFFLSLLLLNPNFNKCIRVSLLSGVIWGFFLQALFIVLYFVNPDLGFKALGKMLIYYFPKIFYFILISLAILQKGKLLEIAR